jgi:hypothetical protein
MVLRAKYGLDVDGIVRAAQELMTISLPSAAIRALA